MVLLDTHALLWWTLDPDKLSPKAARICSRIVTDGGFISSISIWELGIKIKNGALDIDMSIEEYTRRLHAMNCLEIIPVDEVLWMESLRLGWENRDPADRVIVATALSRSLPLVTKDEAMRQFVKKAVW